jgi:hypothetical protein
MPIRNLPSNERGIALMLALVAIIVIGALVTGTLFAGRVELGSGRNALWSAQAQEASEGGLADAFANWRSEWNDILLDTDSLMPAGFPIPGDTRVRYYQTIRRLGGGLFLVTSRGEKLDRGGSVMTTRLLGRIGKLKYPWVDVQAAVTSKGDTRVGGNATIDGRNTSPDGWGACTGTDLAGIRTNEVVIQNGTPQIYGSPPKVEHDAGVVDSIFTVPFDALQPVANIALPPGTYNSMAPSVTGSPAVCNKTSQINWGEPRRGAGSVAECYPYFPVIYTPGDLHLTGGYGQGILLVEGNLQMQGGFEFTGIVIVKGTVETTANSSKVTGAILARNVDLGDITSFGGTPVVAYSRCAVEAALRAATRAYPLAGRGWAQVNGK